uniref:Putative secreted protein n=1 Tax=Psorophora albipes TaxID=869069 RepID=T1DIG3_9DIPT
MKRTFLLLAFASCASLLLACDQPTKHYSSMGCIPNDRKDDRGCPWNYDCPNLTNRQKDKCYLFGKVYAVGEQVPEEETSSTCTAALACISDGEDQQARFIYAYVDCAEFFRPPTANCTLQYKPNRCCSSGQVCSDEVEKLAKCKIGSETFLEGQRMQIPGKPCRNCICSAGFNEGNTDSDSNCYDDKCGFEIHGADSLYSGAAPVYKEGYCCPWFWREPKETDQLVKGPTKCVDSKLQCKYGKFTMNIGDSLQPVTDQQGTYRCSCGIPPLVHCMMD